jgi:Tfp pilus assembly protein PilV
MSRRQKHLKSATASCHDHKVFSRPDAGVSLVETLIALAIFATFTTGACKVFMATRRVSDMARAHYVAVNLAKNRLEIVRAFPFDQLTAFAENNVIVNVNGEADSTGQYSRSTAVTAVSTNLMEVVVAVNIQNRKTLKFDGGVETVASYFSKYLEQE